MANLTRATALLTLIVCLVATPSAQQQQPAPVFRANLNLVSVDVIVRDMGVAGYLPPVIAAWLPVILAGSLSVVLFDTLET